MENSNPNTESPALVKPLLGAGPQREIKFRAWDETNKEFVPEYFYLDYLGRISDIDTGRELVQPHPEMKFVVQQFTGLKDCKGKEIWEGDVIKTPRGDWGVIIYKAPFFEVTVSEISSSLYSREWLNQSEVIGNIFENPEFLSK